MNSSSPQWHVGTVHVLSAVVQLLARSWLLSDQRSALTRHYESNPEPEKRINTIFQPTAANLQISHHTEVAKILP